MQTEPGDLLVSDGEWNTSVPDAILTAKLSVHAKLLWICIKSFASKDSPRPFPGRDTVCAMMGINKDTFTKYKKELLVAGYLKQAQRRQNGGFQSNIYTISAPATKLPCPTVSDTPCPIESDTPCPTVSDTKSTSIKSTSIKSTSPDGAVVGKEPSKHQQFIEQWVLAYKEHHGCDYDFKTGRDGKAVKELLGMQTPAPELLKIAQSAWARAQADEKAWNCAHAATIHGFRERINEIRFELKPKGARSNHVSALLKPDGTPYPPGHHRLADGSVVGPWIGNNGQLLYQP